jgi:hypothetical protein
MVWAQITAGSNEYWLSVAQAPVMRHEQERAREFSIVAIFARL